jgi:acyl-coenzyme A thioesterase PaaI-like protein
VDTGPEALFRLGELSVSEDDVFDGSMAMGPWLEVDGRTPAGALAVLVDDVLGFALVEHLPRGRWSVSAEITMDVLRPLPVTGNVRATGALRHQDGLGALATGEVRDEGGELLALVSQRGRFVVAPPDLVEEGSWGAPLTDGDLERLAAVRAGVPMPIAEVLANEGGTLHGGVSLYASTLVAEATAPGLVTASVHITYARAVEIGAEVTWRPSVRHPGRSLTVVDVDGVVDDRVCTTARVVLHPPACSRRSSGSAG